MAELATAAADAAQEGKRKTVQGKDLGACAGISVAQCCLDTRPTLCGAETAMRRAGHEFLEDDFDLKSCVPSSTAIIHILYPPVAWCYFRRRRAAEPAAKPKKAAKPKANAIPAGQGRITAFLGGGGAGASRRAGDDEDDFDEEDD